MTGNEIDGFNKNLKLIIMGNIMKKFIFRLLLSTTACASTPLFAMQPGGMSSRPPEQPAPAPAQLAPALPAPKP